MSLYKYAVCARCGLEWNVPRDRPVPEKYICPKCEEYLEWCEEFKRLHTKTKEVKDSDGKVSGEKAGGTPRRGG